MLPLLLASLRVPIAVLEKPVASAIAFEAGFGDLSYFNRCFRRRYDASPSDLRAALRR